MARVGPTPPRRARSRGFWNWFAPRYARQPIADEAAYRHKLAVTQSYLSKDMAVLEFGCGTGSTALIHAPFVARIDGIDYAPRMIEIATAKVSAAQVKNVAFHVATIEQWPLPDSPYDIVLGMSILHLVPDRATVLAKVRRMLPPGGLFFSSTVCLIDMPGWVPRILLPLGAALRLLPKVSRLGAADLANEIENAGFEIVSSWRPGPGKDVFIVARAV